MEKFEVKWEAPEFLYQVKDVSWYWMSIILAIIILAIAVWQQNFLFGVFVIIAEMLILIWGNTQPKDVKFKVTEKGIHLGERQFYPYGELAYFSIDEEVDYDWSEIYLTFKTKFHPPVRALIPDKNVEAVRSRMKLFLKETEHQMTLSDALIRFLGL
ncbi:MAG: hypothetical protein M1334_00155 [Patescibacteria group bacterium]|nr:hypothetical protein [Patescibacteria group bacterium]